MITRRFTGRGSRSEKGKKALFLKKRSFICIIRWIEESFLNSYGVFYIYIFTACYLSSSQWGNPLPAGCGVLK